MSATTSIEIEGKTIKDAVQKALKILKLKRDKVKIEVLSEEEKATRLRRRQEALAKARRVYAAQRRAEGEARLAEAKQCAKDLERAAKKAKAASRVVKKPGRILALSGWKGWG